LLEVVEAVHFMVVVVELEDLELHVKLFLVAIHIQ
jgi:hypothetical protein